MQVNDKVTNYAAMQAVGNQPGSQNTAAKDEVKAAGLSKTLEQDTVQFSAESLDLLSGKGGTGSVSTQSSGGTTLPPYPPADQK